MNPVRRRILTLALPVSLSALLERAVVTTDILFVGGLGPSAIAAVGIAQLIAGFALALLSWLSLGSTTLVAQLWGAGRREEAIRGAWSSFVAGMALSLLFAAIGVLFSAYAPRIVGASQTVSPLVSSYLSTLFLFFPLTFAVDFLSATMYGIGDTRTPMKGIVLINLIHVGVAYPLIYGTPALALPGLGVKGAALSAGLSEIIGGFYLFRQARRRGYLCRSDFDPPAVREVARIGLPLSADRLIQQGAQIVYARAVLFFGTVVYAAHQIGLAVEALSFTIGSGFATAAVASVGQSVGAQEMLRAREENREARCLAVWVMGLMGIGFFLFPRLFLRPFTSDPEVIRLGILFLRIVAFLQVPLAITMVVTGTLRGAGDTAFLLLVGIVGGWCVRVPLSILFSSLAARGWIGFQPALTAVWVVMLIDWIVRMGLVLARFGSKDWRGRPMIPIRVPFGDGG